RPRQGHLELVVAGVQGEPHLVVAGEGAELLHQLVQAAAVRCLVICLAHGDAEQAAAAILGRGRWGGLVAAVAVAPRVLPVPVGRPHPLAPFPPACRGRRAREGGTVLMKSLGLSSVPISPLSS